MNREEFTTLLMMLGWEHHEKNVAAHPTTFFSNRALTYDIYILRDCGFYARVKIWSNGSTVIWFDYGDQDFGPGPVADAAKFFVKWWEKYKNETA